MAAFFLLLAILWILACRGGVHQLPALLGACLLFGLGVGMSISQFGKVFGTGFGQTMTSLGLPVLAGVFVTEVAGGAGWARGRFLPAIGMLAGAGAVPAASFAVLAPLRRAGSARDALRLGLALSAGQAFLLPSPVLIAAGAILAAPWRSVLWAGCPLAVLATLMGAILATSAQADQAQAGPSNSMATRPMPRRLGFAVAAACLAMAGLLIVQSLGDIPSEPFGGGPARELILGVGRPLPLLLCGGCIIMAGAWPWPRGAMGDAGWPARAITAAAPLMLLLAVAGGLQALNQTTHMAELLAEHVLVLHWGLAVPFLAAMVMKLLQGSSLVAAITAAGMVQPLLPALGLDADFSRALATLAVGAGALAGSHINDPLFWSVAEAGGLWPHRALPRFTLATLLQGVLGLACLLVVRAVT